MQNNFIFTILKNIFIVRDSRFRRNDVLQDDALKDNVLRNNVLQDGVLRDNVLQDDVLKDGVLRDNTLRNDVLWSGVLQTIKKFFYLLLCYWTFNAYTYDTNRTFQAGTVPKELKGIQIDEKLGDSINLDLQFYNEKNKVISLGSYFNQEKPVLLTIVYYKCPNLCQLHLNGLVTAIDQLNMDSNFEFVAVSLDPTEKPLLARTKKRNYIQQAASSTGKNWHFLTGIEKNILKLSQQVGFKFKWNEQQKQYAHLPVAYILTPTGQISRYLYGVEMDPKTLKLSLVEASQGRIGGLINRILLFCFQFDPRKNKYTLYAYNIMKVGGLIMILLLLALLWPAWKPKGRAL